VLDGGDAERQARGFGSPTSSYQHPSDGGDWTEQYPEYTLVLEDEGRGEARLTAKSADAWARLQAAVTRATGRIVDDDGVTVGHA
jgi:hypothetical protein